MLAHDGPVAIVVRERLRPVGGPSSAVFPPTYAGREGYCIDPLPDGHNRCVLDSVQSQANRIELRFMAAPYASLVPQVVVQAGDVRFNVLEMAHRLADASVRFSSLGDQIDSAFRALADSGDVGPVAKLSPLSLIFGVWDSRGTGAKVQRAFSSIVYADDVVPLTRATQFFPSFSAENVEVLEKLKKEIEKKSAVIGLSHVPSEGAGGVLVRGRIVRESVLNLIALRQLNSAESPEHVRSYLLSLSLIALTMPQDYNLRSGCQLVRDGADSLESLTIWRDGSEATFAFEHATALELAGDAARTFGVEKGIAVYQFDVDKAREYLKSRV